MVEHVDFASVFESEKLFQGHRRSFKGNSIVSILIFIERWNPLFSGNLESRSVKLLGQVIYRHGPGGSLDWFVPGYSIVSIAIKSQG
jgi:hypothetical protein